MDKIYGYINNEKPLTIEERELRAQAYLDKVAERRARRAERERKRKAKKRAKRQEFINMIYPILHRIFFFAAVLLAVLICTGYAGGVL